MLKNITIGQYFPGNSFVHRLDPRTKLLLTLGLIVVVFLSQGFLGFAACLAMCCWRRACRRSTRASSCAA